MVQISSSDYSGRLASFLSSGAASHHARPREAHRGRSTQFRTSNSEPSARVERGERGELTQGSLSGREQGERSRRVGGFRRDPKRVEDSG